MKYKLIISILVILLLAGVFYVFSSYKEPELALVENITTEVKDVLPTQEGLPPIVEAKRQAIYKAVLSRDYNKLAQETGANFYYSFGGEYEGGFVGYLKLSERDEGESVFDIITTLLKLPYAKTGDIYVWPSVFTIEPSKWTTEDINMMRTFLTNKQIEDFRGYGGYIYYRLGITSLGEWTFYLAGD